MLTDLQQRITRLAAFDFAEELRIAVSANLDRVPDYLRQQLASGKTGDDEPATIFGRSGYSPRTVAIKQANGEGLGAVTDHVTNYMTGDFYRSLVTRLEGDAVESDSDVGYFGDILLYSPVGLLRVNRANRLDFAKSAVLPAVRASMLEKTGLTIT